MNVSVMTDMQAGRVHPWLRPVKVAFIPGPMDAALEQTIAGVLDYLRSTGHTVVSVPDDGARTRTGEGGLPRLLDELRAALDAADPVASADGLATLEKALHGKAGGARVDELRRRIIAYDFEAAAAELEFGDDLRGGADYRHLLCRELTARAVREVLS